jgi:small subunit ribosomal protein S5
VIMMQKTNPRGRGGRPGGRRRRRFPRRKREPEDPTKDWIPKSDLGKEVMAGKEITIDDLFKNGIKIRESQIVDKLVSNLQSEIVMIGGSSGKGGGIKRTPSRRTVRMHKSGRRFRVSSMSVVGNSDGYVGCGLAVGPPGKNRNVMLKSLSKAKLSIIPVRRGCGSWECRCGGNHSIPFTVHGKCGSVKVTLIPAPKGLGLCVSDEVKKVMRLAGISDIWCKTRGQTRTRINLIRAVFDALQQLNSCRIQSAYQKATGMKLGMEQ